MDEHQLSFLNHLPLTRQAVSYAQEQHGDQRRKADGAPIVLHLLEVASLLDRSGYPDHVVAAAVLHDVLEDTETERGELDERFGSEVGQLVALVSDDLTIPGEEDRKDDVRERVRRAGGEAAVVYAADKVTKVRELRQMMQTPPTPKSGSASGDTKNRSRCSKTRRPTAGWSSY
jgi:(p)ppGpp synthase/HD superfamily hydrolase